MKQFIKFYQKDKQFVKMINQSEKGFELIITSDKAFKELLEKINAQEEQDNEISVVWQMKFKKDNFILYKNCIFSAPDGKKIKVTCSGVSFYSESEAFKNRSVKKTKAKYKDGTLLNRMLKINELNSKSAT